MLGQEKEKNYSCKSCGFQFTNLYVSRICSNCFACTGCEIYVCLSCKNEVVIKPMKTIEKDNQ